MARLLPSSVLYGRCTRHRGNLPHTEFLYLGDFIVFPFKSTIHGPQWENVVSSLLCFGQTPYVTNVNCYIIFANAFLFIPEVFPSADKPKLFCIWPQGIQSPFSSNRHFSLGGPLMGSIERGGMHTQRGQEAHRCPRRAATGQSAAFPSHCRQSLDSSWTRTHPGSVLSMPRGSPPQCDQTDMFLAASSL